MSTKTKKICVEVEQINSIRKRVEVLEAFERYIAVAEEDLSYHENDAKAYAEQGMDSYAEKQLKRAKSYEYVVELLKQIASEI